MTAHNVYNLGETPSATRITPSGTHSGMDITIQNINSSANVYIGGENVSPDNFGYRIAPGHAWSIELPGRDELWLCSDTENALAAVLKTNLESQD